MKAYTIGIPVATVLFLALIVGSLMYVRSQSPHKSELASESETVLRFVRDELSYVPKVNADKTGVTVYIDADLNVTTLRVHGLMNRPYQQELVDRLVSGRSQNQWRSIVVHFHYPESRPDVAGDADMITMPTHEEQPAPFRTERL